MRGLGLGFTNLVGTWGKWDRCLCFGCGGVGVGRLGPGSWRVGWCYVCVCCESGFFVLIGRFRYLYIMLGRYLRILGSPYRYLLPNLYLSVADIANPDLFVCGSRTWISLDIARFYEKHCQLSGGFAWLACQKNSNGAGRGRHNLHRVCQTVVTAPPRVGCVVWSRLISFNNLISTLNVNSVLAVKYNTVMQRKFVTYF